jgi:NAD(P)H-hydrate epimerase
MTVLTAAQMREADQRAIAAGFPGLVLMENAAYALLRHLEAAIEDWNRERVAIFCGKGNNGADGLALARLLRVHHPEAKVRVFLRYQEAELSPDAQVQLRMLQALGLEAHQNLPADLAITSLAVDALLGTGFQGNVREEMAEWIEAINELPEAKVWAVDTPSALGGSPAVRADVTVTFAAPKVEQVMGETAELCGRLIVSDIGIPRDLLESDLRIIEPRDFLPVLAPRSTDSHKGTHGHVGIVGGDAGKHGALQLAGQAALRCGAGLVTLTSPDANFRPHLPDLMREDLPHDSPPSPNANVLVIGPGLGLRPELDFGISQIALREKRPVLLDADALNRLSPWNLRIPEGRLRILTPHPKEMQRLLGREYNDPILAARSLAMKWNLSVVLKGHRTVVAFPDGKTWINLTGGPALAKGGSGDVLSGMIAAFLAQFPQYPSESILAAVYLHGRCGELAAQYGHERYSLASELMEYFPEALNSAGG